MALTPADQADEAMLAVAFASGASSERLPGWRVHLSAKKLKVGLSLLHRTKRDFDSAAGGHDWPASQVRPLSVLMPGVFLRIQRQWKSTESQNS